MRLAGPTAQHLQRLRGPVVIAGAEPLARPSRPLPRTALARHLHRHLMPGLDVVEALETEVEAAMGRDPHVCADGARLVSRRAQHLGEHPLLERLEAGACALGRLLWRLGQTGAAR